MLEGPALNAYSLSVSHSACHGAHANAKEIILARS